MSSNPLVTPQKRTRRQNDHATSSGSAKKRAVAGGAPSPNPPLSPFPTALLTPSTTPIKLTPTRTTTRGRASAAAKPATPAGPSPLKRPLTPPLTPHSRRLSTSSSTVIVPASPSKVALESLARGRTLPPHLQTVLLLNNALDLTLSLHMATRPPMLPTPTSTDAESLTYVDLPDAANYLAVKATVERTCGRNFGIPELRKLVWLWGASEAELNGSGAALGPQRSGMGKGKGRSLVDEDEGIELGSGSDNDEDVAGPPMLQSLKVRSAPSPLSKKISTDALKNPFLDALPSRSASNTISATAGPILNLPHHAHAHLLTLTRTIDPSTSRRVYTYGLGIRIPLTAAESLELSTAAARASASSSSLFPERVGGGVGKVDLEVKGTTKWVARWSAGSERRSREVERRLWVWVDANGGRDVQFDQLDNLAFAPSAMSSPSTPSHPLSGIASPPLASLPPLPASVGAGLLPAFSLPRSTATADSSSGKKIPPSGTAGAGKPEEDVFGEVRMIPQPEKKLVKGSVEERRQALYDRIKARQGNANAVKGLASNSAKGMGSSSRLAAGNLSAAETQNELKRRSTLSRLESVAESVWMFFSLSPVSGSLVNNSPGSPRARRRAFPMQEVMDIVVKSSKTPISAAESRDSLVLLTELCPTFLVQRVIARQEWLEMPATAHTVVTSPVAVGRVDAVGGPVSPGRITTTSRSAGLSMVRERIRKELGEW